jgi:hypothetical protein
VTEGVGRRRSDKVIASVSGRIIEDGKIEAREAFGIKNTINLDDLPARNRKPHHREGPPVGHDDNSRGAVHERGTPDSVGQRKRDRSPRHFGRSTANERDCWAPFPAI